MLSFKKLQFGIAIAILITMVAVVTARLTGFGSLRSVNFWLACCIMMMSLYNYIIDGTKWSFSQLLLLLVLMINSLIISSE